MSWRDRSRAARPKRPKRAKLPREALERLRDRTIAFIDESIVLRALVEDVQLARGRLYLWYQPDDLIARLTPLSRRTLLLEAPWGDAWTGACRGPLTDVLAALEADTRGTFHGLGALATDEHDDDTPAQVTLHRELGIPIDVLAEPRDWYARHRVPNIAEVGDDCALVRFVAETAATRFHGTCLYARRAGEWGCYTVKPSASKDIASAVNWLSARDWVDWG